VNSKVQIPLEKLLGFAHKDTIQDVNDKFVSKNIIQESLETYQFETEDNFLNHFLYSACTPKGLYSYNKLKLKLKKGMEAVPFAAPLQNTDDDEDEEELFNEGNAMD